MAFLGAGVQARSHLLVLEARGYAETRVYARRPEAREDLSAWAAEAVPDLVVQVTDDPRAAVEGAGTVVSGLSIGRSSSTTRSSWRPSPRRSSPPTTRPRPGGPATRSGVPAPTGGSSARTSASRRPTSSSRHTSRTGPPTAGPARCSPADRERRATVESCG
ncbi:hypothetical protein ACF3NS_12400 [Arsenicicoccus cauae]|uniref:hypothetical protein n=1 Tax=Arsenicicoccus cauae TaxID=2663847 RepID=UPI00370D83DD